MHLIRIFSITAMASLLAACSGGGSTIASHTASAPTSPVITPNANGKTTATIHIHLTPKSHAVRLAKSSKRKPQFVDRFDSNGVIVSDVLGTGPTQNVFADVRSTSPLSPLCTPDGSGGFNCNIVAPAVPGTTNTYTVTLLDALADCTPGITPGCVYSLQNEGTNGNAPGYGSSFAPTNPVTTVVLSIGTSIGVTPMTGTNTAVSIVLDPVVANMTDDSVGQVLQVPMGTPGQLVNPLAFVDNSTNSNGETGAASIYVVVQNQVTPGATSDTFGPFPEDADQASIVNATGGTQFFVGPTDVQFPISVMHAPVVASTTTGVTITAPNPLSFGAPTQFGPLPVAFTYDGMAASISPERITVAETTPGAGGPPAINPGDDQFGNNYNETPGLNYVVAPYSLSTQTINGLATSGTATVTASVFGAMGFTVTSASAGNCAPNGSTALATFGSSSVTTNSATGNNVSTITVTNNGTLAGATCTFQIVASFTPTAPPGTPVTILSAPITVNF